MELMLISNHCFDRTSVGFVVGLLLPPLQTSDEVTIFVNTVIALLLLF
jgi:hypothetical protein